MKIGVTLSKFAYTPEAYAYENYLRELGHEIQLDYYLDPNNDINIYFMGFIPFWKTSSGNACEIHEYQSLSTPPHAKIKNFAKKTFNRKPNGRIYLNNLVKNDLGFNDNNYIIRDMGVDSTMFQIPKINPDYDIVYCGSINGRSGLINVLLNLSKNYNLIVVGDVSLEVKEIFTKNNIHMTGKLSREEIPEVYSNCRYGLNYTPDIYPYNIQTSTKTLEYIASGLGVISNKYIWIEDICKKLNFQPIWLHDDLKLDFSTEPKYCEEIRKFSWENILDDCKFNDFLIRSIG